MDLTPLIRGLLVVIGISIVLGKYGALQKYARQEAVASLQGWNSPVFFPGAYRRILIAPHPGQVHQNEMFQGEGGDEERVKRISGKEFSKNLG